MPEGIGLQAKLLADECIDACAHAQNMVEAIVECQQSAGKLTRAQAPEPKPPPTQEGALMNAARTVAPTYR